MAGAVFAGKVEAMLSKCAVSRVIGIVMRLLLPLAAMPAAADDLPAQLVDVHGAEIDVTALAQGDRLFVVTLKATWCPVCQVQLQRLTEKLGRLRSCGATFLVLGPGPRAELTRIAERNPFPYPFIEDVGLAIARAAGLQLGPDQIEPAIFEVDSKREIVWIERGRSARHFNDDALLPRLDCHLRTARTGKLSTDDADDTGTVWRF